MEAIFGLIEPAQAAAATLMLVWLLLRLLVVAQKAFTRDPKLGFKFLALMRLQTGWDVAAKCGVFHTAIFAACIDWHWKLVLVLSAALVILTLLEFFVWQPYFMQRLAAVCRRWEIEQGLTPTV